jgi:drug/metabolite transporter (DMT)-like permease
MSKGVRYMLQASLLFAVMNVLVKLTPNIPAVEIVFFRSIVSLILSYGYLKIQRIDVWGHNRPILILRGLAGSIALCCFFITIQSIPLASAITIHYLSPIFTAIIGIYFVKERVNGWQWLFFAISFGGILIIQGFDARISIWYTTLGVIAAFLSGVAYNCIRKLKTSEHPLVIIFYFPMVTLPLTGIYLFFDFVMPVGIEWFWLLLIGLSTQFAQYFMTKSYQSEDLSKVASLNYIGIIYALGFGYMFFDESYNTLTYFGMGVVLIGVILNVWYKTRLSKKEAKI